MSELRDECYKCLNNQKCLSMADYGSFYCMTRRKFKMPEHEDNKEIIERYYTANEDCISKQKVKQGLEDIEDYFDRLNGPDEDIEYIRQVKQAILKGERK